MNQVQSPSGAEIGRACEDDEIGFRGLPWALACACAESVGNTQLWSLSRNGPVTDGHAGAAPPGIASTATFHTIDGAALVALRLTPPSDVFWKVLEVECAEKEC